MFLVSAIFFYQFTSLDIHMIPGFVVSPVENLLLAFTRKNFWKFCIFARESSSTHRGTETGCGFVLRIQLYVKPWMKLSSAETTFAGMSFLIKSITPPLFLCWSGRNGVSNPSKKKWPSGKEWSNLDSDIIKILILPLMISAKESNLFRIELIIFRLAKISLLRSFLHKVWKLKLTSEFAVSRVSYRQSFTVTKS